MNNDNAKGIFDGEKNHYLHLKSQSLPFVSAHHSSYAATQKADDIFWKFIRLIEKRFDKIWHMKEDYFDDNSQGAERFRFRRGGLMEISMHGEIKAWFMDDKTQALKAAIVYATEKLGGHARATEVERATRTGMQELDYGNSLTAG